MSEERQERKRSAYAEGLQVDLATGIEPLNSCPRCSSRDITAAYQYGDTSQAVILCHHCKYEWLIEVAESDASYGKTAQELSQMLSDAANAEGNGSAEQAQREAKELQSKMDALAKERGEDKEPGKKPNDGKNPKGTDDPKELELELLSYQTEESLMRYFEQRLGAILSDNQFDRRSSGHRSGKLDGRKLYKGLLKCDRIFTKKTERLNKKYNVLIVLDESGSMGSKVNCGVDDKGAPIERTRLDMGVQFFKMLIRAMTKHHINFALMGFNDYMTLHKDWATPVTDLPKLEKEIHKWAQKGGANNHDALALYDAREYILKTAPEDGKNIVIFISDGQPSGSYSSRSFVTGKTAQEIMGDRQDLHADTKKYAKLLEAVCPVVSIGIDTNTVKDFYTNATKVRSAREFSGAILTNLARLITRA